jgi:putative isomerase
VRVLPNYYVCKGLARYGFISQARELALKTAELLANDLERTGRLHDAYDDAGRGLWPPSSGFCLPNVLALSLVRQFAPELTSGWNERAPASSDQG